MKGITTIKEHPSKKMGRLYLLGYGMELLVRAYLTALRANGVVVNTAIAIGCEEELYKAKTGIFLQSMMVT